MKLKRLGLFLPLLLFATNVLAYTGNYSIWYQAKGAFIPTNANGDTTGFGVARDACIRKGGGVIQIGPGAEGVNFTYPTNAGILILRSGTDGWSANPTISSITLTTTGIQQAIDAVCASGGGTVELPADTIFTTAPLWLHSNIHFKGAGRGKTVIIRATGSITDLSPANSGAVIATSKYGFNGTLSSASDTLRNIEISDITLDGNSNAFSGLTSGTPHQAGILAKSCDGLNIHSVGVQNTLRSAYMLIESKNVTCSDVTANHVGQANFVTTRNAFDFYNYNHPTPNFGFRYSLNNFRIVNVGDEAISITSASDIEIANGIIDSTDYALEIQGDDLATPVARISMSNVVTKRQQNYALAFFAGPGGSEISKVRISSCIFEGDSTTNIGGAISASSGNMKLSDLSVSDCSFTNLNTDDTNLTTKVWMDFATSSSINRLILNNNLLQGKVGAIKSNSGIGFQGAISDAILIGNRVRVCNGIGYFLWGTGNPAYAHNITYQSCYAESLGNHGWFIGSNFTNFTIRDVILNSCGVTDGGLVTAGSSAYTFQNNVAATRTARIKILNCWGRKITSGANFDVGLRIGSSNAAMDSIDVIGGDFDDFASPVTVGSATTALRFISSRYSATVSRLGPYSSPTTGGAIRIIDGVTFPLTMAGIQAAASDLPSGGGTILLPDTTITVDAAAILTSGVSLRSLGRGTMFKRSGSFLGTPVFWTGGTARNGVKFSGIVFDNNSLAVTARDIDFSGGSSDILVEGCRWINLSNRVGDLVRVGTSATPSKRVTIRNCTVDGPGSQQSFNSFQIFDASDVTVHGNIINGFGAIKVEGALSTTLSSWNISNNLMRNVDQTNIFTRVQGMANVKGIRVLNNTSINAGKAFLACDAVAASDAGTIQDVTISGNVIRGFGVSLADDAIQVGGVATTKYCYNVSIVGNSINGLKEDSTLATTTERGISVESGTQGVSIIGNTIRNCGRSGIGLSGEDFNVEGNYIERCARRDTGASPPTTAQEGGIAVFGVTSVTVANIQISNNICKNNGVDGTTVSNGISLDANGISGVSNLYVKGNRCYDDQATKTQAYGIAIGSAGNPGPDNSYIFFNDLRGNKTGSSTGPLGTVVGIGEWGNTASNSSAAIFSDSLRVNKGIESASKIVAQDSLRANKGIYVGGAFVPAILKASATLDFNLAAVNCQDLTVTVAGAVVGDTVFIGVPNGSVTTDTYFTGWVSGASTVTIRACKLAGSPDPPSGTFKVTVVQ